jgi:hypothetical protein
VDTLRGPSCLIGAVIALASTASLASASTYCVGALASGCTFSYPGTGAGLQQALDDADTGVDIGGTPDTVSIGPGTFTAAGGFHTMGGDLSVVGSGASTILSSTTNSAALSLKPGGTSGASVSFLQVQINGFGSGIWDFRQVHDVHIGGPGTLFDKGILLAPGGRVSRVLIDPAGTDAGPGIFASSGVIEDSVVRIHPVASVLNRIAISAGPGLNPTGTYTVVVRHVTLIGDDATVTNTIGVLAQGAQSPTADTAIVVDVRDSVIHGFNAPLSQFGIPASAGPACGSSCFNGSASLDSRYSSLSPAGNQTHGPGAITAGPGNLDDPELRLAADASPTAGSPLIDAGDPAPAETGDSATDLAGTPRIVSGRRDIGAFEYTPPPIVPSVPTPPTPPTPPTSIPTPKQLVKLPSFTSVVALASTRTCASRRLLRIHVRQPRGVTITKATVTLNGKRVATRTGEKVTTVINLRGLPKGRFTVKITLTTSDGRTIVGSRTYHTCAVKKTKRKHTKG